MKYLPIVILWLWASAAWGQSAMGTVSATVISVENVQQAEAGQVADCVTDGTTTICYGGVH